MTASIRPSSTSGWSLLGIFIEDVACGAEPFIRGPDYEAFRGAALESILTTGEFPQHAKQGSRCDRQPAIGFCNGLDDIPFSHLTGVQGKSDRPYARILAVEFAMRRR